MPDLRIAQPTLVDELKTGKITVINSMPACREVCELERFPTAVKQEAKDEESIYSFNLDYVSFAFV